MPVKHICTSSTEYLESTETATEFRTKMSSEPDAKKSKMSHNHYKSKRRQYLEVGQRGFLATCNFREKDCVRECYNVLNQYADSLYGPQEEVPASTPQTEDPITDTANNDNPEKESDDIADQLQAEIKATQDQRNNKTSSRPRFQAVDTGATNCLFIRTTLEDPVELGESIVKDIYNTGQQKSRFLLRLLPIAAVCRANLTDILKAAGQLFDKHFLKEPSTFSIAFNKRYNNDFHRDNVIPDLAALVQSKNVGNRVDLKQPQKTIVVEVIKGLCCLSVVEGYLLYRKYNLVELATAKENKEAAAQLAAKAEAIEGAAGESKLKEDEGEPPQAPTKEPPLEVKENNKDIT